MATALITYLGYLLIVIVINIAVLYHFIKYSFPADATKVVIFFYTLTMVSVVGITFFLIGLI